MLAAQARRPRGAFGTVFARMMHDGHTECYAAALGRVGVRPGSRLLEIGCGYGGHISALLAAGVIYTAVDHSPDMIAAAKIKAPFARLICGDVCVVDLPTSDAALAVNVLQWLDDPVDAVDAVRKALIPGSVMVVGVPDACCPDLPYVQEMVRYDAEALALLFRCAGYRNVTVDRIEAHSRRYLIGSGAA